MAKITNPFEDDFEYDDIPDEPINYEEEVLFLISEAIQDRDLCVEDRLRKIKDLLDEFYESRS